MDKWLCGLVLDSNGLPCYNYRTHTVKRVAYYHDENVWECPEEIAKEIGEMGVKSIIKAGEYLKLSVPLAAEFKIGLSWADIH
jgi:DNA polymerase I-like protein with 3'-5' exonuclease and polymerase domains